MAKYNNIKSATPTLLHKFTTPKCPTSRDTCTLAGETRETVESRRHDRVSVVSRDSYDTRSKRLSYVVTDLYHIYCPSSQLCESTRSFFSLIACHACVTCVTELERRVSHLLGKEAAMFVPTGTMASCVAGGPT